MKSLLSLLLVALTCSSGANAQSLKTEFSTPFDEPGGLESKVVQSPNGNTFLFTFTSKDGIDVDVYDKSRKVISQRKLSGKAWDAGIMKKSSIDGIYNIGDNIVMFMEQLDHRTPTLYRIILSAKDGKLVSEEKIAEMPRYGGGAGYAMLFGGVQPKGFYVEKDVNSDAYAVCAFDGFASETAERIEVIHFDGGTHKEIGRAFYDAPANRYKYINFLGMVVGGTKEVHLCTYAYNTKSSGGKESKLILSKLTGNKMEHHPIELSTDLKETKGILSYNRKYNTLEMITMSLINSKQGMFSNKSTTYYSVALMAIDPDSHTILYVKPATTEMATQYRTAHYDNDGDYTGLPMNMFINPDGTVTVLMEESTTIVSRNTSTTILKDIGISDFDERGTEEHGYVVRKLQESRLPTPPLSHHDLRNNRVTFDRIPGFGAHANPGFYSFDYVSTPSGRYVFFNDNPKNFERDAEKQPKKLSAISDANTICYRLNGGEASKFYFFGQPNDSFENRFALITSGDYNEETGDYAVMIIEKVGRRDKNARIAWVHLK